MKINWSSIPGVGCAGLSLWLLAVAHLEAKTIYVDNRLTANCAGNYSVEKRDGSGKDGDAYVTVVEAADVAKAGDIVILRAGTYHNAERATHNDVLWPKHSGTAQNPIVFRARTGETVVLGDGPASYPNDGKLSIARGVVTLQNVSYITIDGLEFRKVAGWLFARNCQHITIQNCTFADALFAAKATARIVECQYCRFFNCSFVNSYDSLQLIKSDFTVVENCDFSASAHTPLALRSANFSVIRNCKFENPFYKKHRAEKLVEVYDVKVDKRDPDNPVVLDLPAYNATKHNLFEYNYFGYHPFRPEAASQPSAMQYSGQDGIIRRNLYINPSGKQIDPKNPEATSGGMGIKMRWGGSWEGWRMKTDGSGGRWWGESMEAGYVTHNRIYNNVFLGYDSGCITTPSEDSMGKTMNPPPLYETNPSEQYSEKFAFEDNRFINNIVSPGQYLGHTKWAWQKLTTGKPVGLTMLGPIKGGLLFLNNDFYATDGDTPGLIYLRETANPKKNNNLVADAATLNEKYPDLFSHNLQQNPMFVNADGNDFQLKEGSPLIDAGAFLTEAMGAGTGSKELSVKDANCFFDGFGIEGEKGDLIQFQGQTETARVIHVDYGKKILTLDHALTWQDGQGVALAYTGKGPDLGVFEFGRPVLVGPPPGSNRVHVSSVKDD